PARARGGDRLGARGAVHDPRRLVGLGELGGQGQGGGAELAGRVLRLQAHGYGFLPSRPETEVLASWLMPFAAAVVPALWVTRSAMITPTTISPARPMRVVGLVMLLPLSGCRSIRFSCRRRWRGWDRYRPR